MQFDLLTEKWAATTIRDMYGNQVNVYKWINKNN